MTTIHYTDRLSRSAHEVLLSLDVRIVGESAGYLRLGDGWTEVYDGTYTVTAVERASEAVKDARKFKSGAARFERFRNTLDEERDTYRAAVWSDRDGGEVVLTGPEHANLGDNELLLEAHAEARRAKLDRSRGWIGIGDWTE